MDSYLDDYQKMWSYLKDNFDYEAKIFRFPGGSINMYNLDVYDKIAPEMLRRGFRYYDWNVSAEDASFDKRNKNEIVTTIIPEVKMYDKSIVLFHDSSDKDSTVAALPTIIKKLKAAGYTFKALDNSVEPITFTN